WYGYRVPPKGQVQVVVKNPNKTAVKVFLCPYDLTDMPPETKTFLKQRTYHDPTSPASAASSPCLLESRSLSPAQGFGQAGRPEPAVDGCSPSPVQQQQRTAPGSPRPPTRSPVRLHERMRPALRYAIHMQFLCPKRGKIYLHRGIRVVFSHRVPDGSEYIRVVNDVPNPKYTSLALPPRGRPDRELERDGERDGERTDLPREEADGGQAECARGGPPWRNASPVGTMEIDAVVGRRGGRGRSGHPDGPASVGAEPARSAAVAVAGTIDSNGNRCAARDSLSGLAMGLSAADHSEPSDSIDGRHVSHVSAPGSMPLPVPSVIGADENRTR
ncbi:MAG: chromosome segregation during meiosis-domain-containing protein, partial [Olpidium bornovanus]